jgi:hypothetical protein
MQTSCTAALLAAGLLASALALPAQAADAPALVAPAFGNTVMSIYPDGRSQKIWLHPDGTWDGKSRRGNPLAGKWSVKNDKVCLKQSKPPVGPFAFCQPFPAEVHVGVGWTAKDMTGVPIQIKIVKGLVEAKAAN